MLSAEIDKHRRAALTLWWTLMCHALSGNGGLNMGHTSKIDTLSLPSKPGPMSFFTCGASVRVGPRSERNRSNTYSWKLAKGWIYGSLCYQAYLSERE